MKIVMFSNFPPSFNEQTLGTKLAKYNVDILRTVNMDRNTTTPTLHDCDAVVAMVELLSNMQRNKVKDYAKRANKKYVPLLRKEDEHWVKAFGEPQIVRTAEHSAPIVATITPIEPSKSDEKQQESQENELRELIALYEDENKRLLEEHKSLNVQLKESKEFIEKAKSEVTNAFAERDSIRKERDSLTKMNAEQEKLIATLRQKPTVKQVQDLTKAIDSFKTLRRMGIMSDSDIVEKLFSIKEEK